MILRYSKPSGPLLELKKGFFQSNDVYLKEGQKINRLYAQQPKRSHCKNCNFTPLEKSFSKQGVDYGFCSRCKHLNGLFEDTSEFCAAVYTDDGGESYAKDYCSEERLNYETRVKEIYLPKAEFLTSSLAEMGEKPGELKFADFGAGSGYFVGALLKSGQKKVVGYEASEAQVRHGNQMIEGSLLKSHSLEETLSLAKSTDADVVSMIGVLEHLQNPRDVLAALRKNKNIRYLYISVPTFSPAIFFEMAFPTVMQRQLTGAHTHLYTEDSLKYMAKEFQLELVSAWWFGTDIVDLFRSMSVKLEQHDQTKKMVPFWTEMFTPLIDSLQAEVDKRHNSSEVHMLYQCKN